MNNATAKPKERNSSFCLFVTLMTQIPIAFFFGINLSALNSSTPAIQVFINNTYTSRYGKFPSASNLIFILALAQSALIWGSLAGSFLATLVLTKLSRKRAVLLLHGVNIFSVILMGPIAQYAPSYESLIVGRFVAGVVRGIAFSVCPVVVAETTCRKRLGFYQSQYAPCLFVSAALGAGLGHPKVLGTPELWMWIVCAPAVGSIIYVCVSPWLPETPVSLLRNGKLDEALSVLHRLRKESDVEAEFLIIQNEIKEESCKTAIPISTIIKTPSLRRQLYTTVILMNGVQFVGLQVVTMYSDSQLLSAGVPPDLATFATMAIFLQCLVAFLVAVPIQGRFGTKKVYLIGLYIVSISYIVFIISNALQSSAMTYTAVVSMCIAVFGMQLGPQCSLFALPTELTTANSRPTVLYYSSCIFWILGGLISFIFPYSLAAWGAFSYLPFVVMTIALIAFIKIMVPETHRRTAEEIQSSFRKRQTQTTMLMGSNDEEVKDKI